MNGKKLVSLLLTTALILALLPTATLALNEQTSLPETVQVSGAGESEPAPEEPLPKGRMGTRAGEISITKNSVYANGIPIVIKENNGITSVYSEDDMLLSGTTNVKEYWIFGGVQSGEYVGDTSVTVESGTLIKNIYGGNNGTDLTGDTYITINGGTVAYLFGGNQNYGTVTGNTHITVNDGTVTGWVYGGGAGYQDNGQTHVAGDTHVTINGGLLQKNIYGGASGRGATVRNSNVTITGGTVKGAVFGGGERESVVSGKASVIVDGDPTISGSVYGGGAGFDQTNATVNSAEIQIKSGTIHNGVFGGGAGFTGVSNTTGDVSISVSGGSVFDVAASDNANSKVTGNVSIRLTGGTIRNACYLTGYYEPANQIKDVTLTIGKDVTFGANAFVDMREQISGDLSIDIDGIFIKLVFWDNVLPADKKAKVTYRNIGSPEGKWAGYDDYGGVQTTGTNPVINSPATGYGSLQLRKNKLTEFALVNSYVDFKDESITDRPQDFAAFTNKLTLDGGALRCFFLMDSNFPLTEFKNNPLLYYGYHIQGGNFGTSTMNFAETIGTATVQLLARSGVVTEDPLHGSDVKPTGIDCVVAPWETDEKTFMLQTNEVSKGKQLWGTNTVQLGGDGVTRKLWQVLKSDSCKCQIGTANLSNNVYYLGESDSFTLADWRDKYDNPNVTASCPLVGHKGSKYQVAYALVPGENTTAPGATITENQLTVTDIGQVEVKITATLNGKVSEDNVILYIMQRPAEKQYTFCINPSAPEYKDIVMVYRGVRQETNVDSIIRNETSREYLKQTDDFTYEKKDDTHTLTIKKEYLAKLGETELKEYSFAITFWANKPNMTSGHKMKILVTDKQSTTLTLTPDKTADIVYGDRVTYQAAVAPFEPLRVPALTGTVQFKLDGNDYGTSMELDAAQITLDHTKLTVGTHTISAVYSGDDNYIQTSDELEVTVNKAALTVKPKDVKITAGAALPVNQVEYIGLVGDDLSDVVKLSSGTLDMEYRNAADNGILANTDTAGTYKIVLNGSPVWTADNYTIATGDGALTIESRPNSGGGSGGSSGGGGGGGVTPPKTETVPDPKTETVTNPDGSVSKTETVTKKDPNTGATIETKTETTTAPNDSVSKKETITISGGKDGVSGTVVTTTSATGETKVAITLTSKDDKNDMTLPAAVTDAVKGNEVSATIGVGEWTLTMDSKALAAILEVGGQTPLISVTPVTKDKLPETLQGKALGYTFTVNGKGADFDGGTTLFSVPYTKQDASKVIGVFYVGTDGQSTRISGVTHQDGVVSFPQSHWSVYAIVEEDALPFTDVAEGVWYYDAVRFALEKNITKGTDTTTFSPDMSCTRAQTVTFLWNAMGKPTPTSVKNPFADVAAGNYYYDAVLWAVEKGITSGTSATTFSPDQSITRAEFVTFLHRAAGQPAATASNPFTDVTDKDAYYTKAVLWAVEAGITNGTTATTFSPEASCTRAQVVTFLYNYLCK